jgi:hypothetical protein
MNENKIAALGQKAASKDSKVTIAHYRQFSRGIASDIFAASRDGGGR